MEPLLLKIFATALALSQVMTAPDAVKTFDDWLARGCTGMRLFTTGSTLPNQSTWFVDPRTYPFWEHAAAKNIPVCMQMKQEGLPLLRQLMDRFPKVTMILDHLARAPFEDGPPRWPAERLLGLRNDSEVRLGGFPSARKALPRLVVAGLAARDAVGALGRLLELGSAQDRPALRPRLAGTLRGVVAQQLVPRADGKGRVAAAELLLVDDETRRLVREPGGEAALRAGLATGRPPGSQGFDASLVALARARRISPDAALSRASDAAAVRELLGRAEDGSPKAAVEDDVRAD